MFNRVLWALIVVCLLTLSATTQSETSETTQPTLNEDDYIFTLEVDSAFVRARPTRSAEAVASIFEDERLVAVGRNLDGTWLEVKRPGRMTNLGWVAARLGDRDFRTETLPLTDLETGLVGAAALESDPGFAAFILESVVVRAEPQRTSERVTSLPFGVTVPVVERDPTNEWLRINYLGQEGWIVRFTARRIDNIDAIPIAPLAIDNALAASVPVIPPEVQLAQIERLREFINPRLSIANGLTSFWRLVYRGEAMPCEPPNFGADPFALSDADVRELPELRRYVPRVDEATLFLDTSIEALRGCGAIMPNEVVQARNDAINAAIIYEEALLALTATEAIIR